MLGRPSHLGAPSGRPSFAVYANGQQKDTFNSRFAKTTKTRGGSAVEMNAGGSILDREVDAAVQEDDQEEVAAKRQEFVIRSLNDIEDP